MSLRKRQSPSVSTDNAEIAEEQKNVNNCSYFSKNIILASLVSLYVGFTIGSTRNRGMSVCVEQKTITGGDDGIPNACSGVMPNFTGVPTFKNRAELGKILQEENKTIGVELGVQRGYFSRKILQQWASCKEYHLVDIWAHQENYHDNANLDQASQDKIYETALQSTKPWEQKRRICRNFTSECVKKYSDNYFDFIYVDARHDFKGVHEDLVSWWPKLRPGGIMAGHDYVTQDDGPSAGGQNWTVNYDGTIDKTGTVVKGAVDKFSNEVCRQLTISYREGSWNSWALRK